MDRQKTVAHILCINSLKVNYSHVKIDKLCPKFIKKKKKNAGFIMYFMNDTE